MAHPRRCIDEDPQPILATDDPKARYGDAEPIDSDQCDRRAGDRPLLDGFVENRTGAPCERAKETVCRKRKEGIEDILYR